MQKLRGLHQLHWLLSCLLLIGLIPAFFLLSLPLRFAWSTFVGAFFGFALQSLLLSIVLYVIGFSTRTSLRPLIRRYKEQRVRIPALLAFSALMVWEFGLTSGLILIVLTTALL